MWGGAAVAVAIMFDWKKKREKKRNRKSCSSSGADICVPIMREGDSLGSEVTVTPLQLAAKRL